MPDISVIVPVYNAAGDLLRCVDSVLRQEDVSLELLLVDDGSMDGSGALCDQYAAADPRVKVLHRPNGGVSSARNAGLREASGALVMFVDSDDYMLPGMCRLMTYRMASVGADLVICGTTEPNGGLWAPERDASYASRTDFDRDFEYWLRTELLGPPWNKLYRQSLINHFFPEDVSFGEDLIFNLAYLSGAQRIEIVKAAPFFHEKARGTSLVNRYDGKKLTDIEAMQRVLAAYCAQSGIEVPAGKYLRDLLVYAKGLLKSPKLSAAEKRRAVRTWRASNPRLRSLPLADLGLTLKDKIFLWLLLHF